MKNYKYILLDLDGTICESKEGIINSYVYALDKYNIKIDDYDEMDKVIGPPLSKSFAEFYGFDEGTVKEAIGYYRKYYGEKGIFENRLYDGIPNLLKNLKETGKKLFVATSKSELYVSKILEHYDILQYFDGVVGSATDGSRIEKEDIIRYILRNMMCDDNLESAIMIGDRKFDIEGAHANNMDSIAVLYGYGTENELSGCNPTFIAPTVADIFRILA